MRKWLLKVVAAILGFELDTDKVARTAHDQGYRLGRESIRFETRDGKSTADALRAAGYRAGKHDAEARCEQNRMEFEQAVKEAYFEATN